MKRLTPRLGSIYEHVCWKAKEGISKQQMIEAMHIFSQDVKQLPGFIEETLYLCEDGQWIAVYYWENEQYAHDSNQAVAKKPSFQQLLSLIDTDSITIEIRQPLQSTNNQ